MDKPKDGGTAFPTPDLIYPNGEIQYGQNGMSMRDWFAGMALAGELASFSTHDSCAASAKAALESGIEIEEQIAFNCYSLADAMLAARERENTKRAADSQLLELLKTHPLAEHPTNGNDDGEPCICSSCEWVRRAKSYLNEMEVAS